MKSYSWEELKLVPKYEDVIVQVTDMDNELYIGKNGEFVPLVPKQQKSKEASGELNESNNTEKIA
jgi:hypothetical protein